MQNGLESKYDGLYEKVILVAGARPNFMKIAPLCVELKRVKVPYEIFYSGQHYDAQLFDVFKKDLSLDEGYLADIEMTGNSIKDIQNIMRAFHQYLKKQSNVSCIIVVGDVNTTYACSIVAKRFDNIPLVHVESGLRSFDQSMPEEMNRITVDHLSDILLAPSEDAMQNLKDEGLASKAHLVGNIMIDSLKRCVEKFRAEAFYRSVPPYCVVTFHRPENVDNKEVLLRILVQLAKVAQHHDVYFPIHPRTQEKLKKFGYENFTAKFKVTEPLSYVEFLKLVFNADFVLTDSGGIQEETSYLGIPCFTVRKNTERPITISHGTNKLIKYEDIERETVNVFRKEPKEIPLWDGKTAKRILQVLNKQVCFI